MQYFYAYRIFLTPRSPINFKKKEESFREALESIKRETLTFKDHGEHLVIFKQQKGDNIFIYQLAKKQKFEKTVFEEGKLEDTIDIHYPNVHLIIHFSRQLILIEKNTSIFQELHAVQTKVAKFLSDQMVQDDVKCSLFEITDKREFWEQVDDLDTVQKVVLDYAPPNFFRGSKAADELIRDVHEETNFQKFRIYLQNKYDGLRFNRINFQDHIQRLSQGAGDYLVEGLKDGIRVVIDKFTKLHTRQDIPNIDDQTAQSLEDRFNQVEKVNEDDDDDDIIEDNNPTDKHEND